MSDDLLKQADLLMRRRRASTPPDATPPPAAPSLPPLPALGEDEEIPVLTEEVALDNTVNPTTKIGDDQRRALLAEFDQWLAESLPAEITQALEKLGRHLAVRLADRARHELLPRLLAALETPPTAPDHERADE